MVMAMIRELRLGSFRSLLRNDTICLAMLQTGFPRVPLHSLSDYTMVLRDYGVVAFPVHFNPRGRRVAAVTIPFREVRNVGS